MLKALELRMHKQMDNLDKNNELRVKAQAKSFDGELRKLKDVVEERHVLFVKDVKTVREDVNRNLRR